MRKWGVWLVVHNIAEQEMLDRNCKDVIGVTFEANIESIFHTDDTAQGSPEIKLITNSFMSPTATFV